MNCGFCGKEVPDEVGPADEKSACGSCRGGCRKIHCPHCGYANPAPGKLLKKFLSNPKQKDTK